MSFERQLAFWLATCVVTILLLWLLSDILLPFVAGMVIAYLLDPLTNRLERIGVNRRFAAFLIVGIFVLVFVALLVVLVPLLASQLYALLANIPAYVARLYTLALSMDLRLAGTRNTDGGTESPRTAVFPMQWDGYARAAFTDAF